MKIFDLVFLGSVVACAMLIMRALYLLVRKKWRAAARTMVFLVAFVGAYVAVLIGVSLTSSPSYVPLGTEFRFDDWCFAVVDSQRVSELGDGRGVLRPRGVFQLVTIDVSNRGRGRPQRERNVGAYLLDGTGRRYDVSESGQGALDSSGRGGLALDSVVNAGASVRRTLVFEVPKDAADLGVVVYHGTGPRIIIGESQSYLHAPLVTRLSGQK